MRKIVKTFVFGTICLVTWMMTSKLIAQSREKEQPAARASSIETLRDNHGTCPHQGHRLAACVRRHAYARRFR